MAESRSEHTLTDDRHPFDNFRETVRNLLQVPKHELDEARRKDEATSSQEYVDTSNKS